MADKHAPVDSPRLDDFPGVYRMGAAIPDTPTARANHGLLIRTSQEAGQRAIAHACGHDASWVSRMLNGEGKANLAEWLAWMDAADLRFSRPDAQANVDQELLSVLLRKASSVVDRQRSIQPDNWTPPTYEEHQAALLLVQRYCQLMQESVG